MNTKIVGFLIVLVFCGQAISAHSAQKMRKRVDIQEETDNPSSSTRSLAYTPKVWVDTEFQLLSVSVVVSTQAYVITVRHEGGTVVGSAVLAGDGMQLQLPLSLSLPGVYTVEVANSQCSYRGAFDHNPDPTH